MTCNYFEYREMMDKMFYGVSLTDNHLNNVTEQIRQYIVNGGAGNILKALGIGIKVVTKGAVLEVEIMRVTVQWYNDTNSANFGYAFWCNQKVIARCDESDYHETVDMLRSQGYIVNG